MENQERLIYERIKSMGEGIYSIEMDEAEELIPILSAIVQKHDRLYEEHNPVLTDTDYDVFYIALQRLCQKYPELEQENSPTRMIERIVVEGLEQVAHSQHMGSTEKCTTEAEVLKFADRASGELILSHKLDGATLVCVWSDGVLIDALTRGDGLVGNRILHSAKAIRNLPQSIPFRGRLEVRLEALIQTKEFEEINTDGRFSNARNAASGALLSLDNDLVKDRKVDAVAFNVISAEGMEFKSYAESFSFLEKQGFRVVPHHIFQNDESGRKELISKIAEYGSSLRSTLPWTIDGMIVAFNNLKIFNSLGSTSKYPKGMIAYKFESQNAVSTLEAVTVQVGKSGILAPVAELSEVEIDGVFIKRASLANYRNIREKNIRIGGKVLVERANDVIPYIRKAFYEQYDGSERIIEPPANCPVCGALTEFDGEYLFCTGLDCPAQIERKLQHYVSKKAMDIDGFGNQTMSIFYEAGIVKSILDIYDLEKHKDAICSMEGFGNKKYDRIIKGIEDSKKKGLVNILIGLAINNIGERASKDIAKKFGSMKNILTISQNPETFRSALSEIEGFGDVLPNNAVKFFSEPHNREVVQKLMELNAFTETAPAAATEGSGKLNGLTFCITGDVHHFPNRKALQDTIEELGGKALSGVSAKLNYLITNDADSGSGKSKKAKELGVPVISEDQFLEMIN